MVALLGEFRVVDKRGDQRFKVVLGGDICDRMCGVGGSIR
jgi:hypothetical protein